MSLTKPTKQDTSLISNNGGNMKYYLITITIYDGDYEYLDKSIIAVDEQDFTSDGKLDDLKVLKLFTGEDDLAYDDWLRAYQIPYCHRGYRLYHSQEIEENDLPILRKYHI